jgi:two-component system LytT family response regulator
MNNNTTENLLDKTRPLFSCIIVHLYRIYGKVTYLLEIATLVHRAMLRALIIDDEANNREKLHNLLNNHCPEVQVMGEADGVRSGISAIREHLPDLIFLDIKMDDGSGFDLLNRFEEIDFKVIFVTAYEEYAIRAFRLSAVDYLLKPVDPDELTEAVEKANKLMIEEQKLRLKAVSSNIESGQHRRIVLKEGENIHLVNVGNIIHSESEGNYVRFHVKDEQPILVSRQLKEFEEILEPSGFFRVHKSHLINMAHAKRYTRADGGFVVMDDGTSIPVASRKRERLLELFESL